MFIREELKISIILFISLLLMALIYYLQYVYTEDRDNQQQFTEDWTNISSLSYEETEDFL